MDEGLKELFHFLSNGSAINGIRHKFPFWSVFQHIQKVFNMFSNFSGIHARFFATSLDLLRDRYKVEDQIQIAGGKVGERVANQLEKQLDLPPTVTLYAGTTIGIFIVNAK